VTNIFGKLINKFKKTEEKNSQSSSVVQQKLPGSEEITKPLPPRLSVISKDQFESRRGLNPRQFLSGCAISAGKQREHNEDSLFSLTTTLASNGTQIPFGLYIVADGMGGHQYGEIASEIAVKTMAEQIMAQLYNHLLKIHPQRPEEPLRDILHNSVKKAHEAILKYAPGGGTTLTTVVIVDNQMGIAHVGDSRVYTVTLSGTMKSITRDHSLVRRLEELGQLTAEEAAIHPQRNVLYRALGQGEPFEPEIITAPTPESCYLLICSDGLWGVVPEETLGDIVNSAPTLHQACQEMVHAANSAGGPDNIAIILVRLPD
jgi:serine/threonine protein phosphatase PrpC